MKLIEALKKVKDLLRKAQDLRDLVKGHCAISSLETEKYPTQTKIVSAWIQSHSDIIKEISELRLAIQYTNMATNVVIELGGKQVTKTIAGWIHRRRDLAALELSMWNMLTDRNIKEGFGTGPSGDKIDIKIRRFYDPGEKDTKRELYISEPSIIDSRLEVVNATTDLIE